MGSRRIQKIFLARVMLTIGDAAIGLRGAEGWDKKMMRASRKVRGLKLPPNRGRKIQRALPPRCRTATGAVAFAHLSPPRAPLPQKSPAGADKRQHQTIVATGGWSRA